MKQFLFFSLLTVLLYACGGETEETNFNIPDDIEYTITKEERMENFGKSNITVQLNKKTTEDVLTEIAKEIKSEREDLTNLFIFYYPEGMSTSGFAWATSHFTPDLKVQILGSTEEEDAETASTDDIPGEVIGKWRSDVSLMGASLILYKGEDGKLYMQTNFKSGKPMTEELSESSKNGLKRYDYDNTHGEYYILESNGNLGMYDADGKFDEATILN